MESKQEERAETKELKEFIREVRKMSKDLRFPIEAPERLVEQIGGQDVEWRGKRHPIDQALKIVPDYFFPIESEEDLVVKAVNLELLRPGNSLSPKKMGEESKPKNDVGKPPADLGQAIPSKREGGPAVIKGRRERGEKS